VPASRRTAASAHFHLTLARDVKVREVHELREFLEGRGQGYMLRVRSNGGNSAQQGGGSARLTRLDDYIQRPPAHRR
jgi:hypothetical protein